MFTLKWIIGLVCFLYPTRVEGLERTSLGVKDSSLGAMAGETLAKSMVHADQTTCGTVQALTNTHAT